MKLVAVGNFRLGSDIMSCILERVPWILYEEVTIAGKCGSRQTYKVGVENSIQDLPIHLRRGVDVERS